MLPEGQFGAYLLQGPAGGCTKKRVSFRAHFPGIIPREVEAPAEITTDGGQSWTAAELQTPVLPKAHTRFRWSWKWDGRDALLASRATDETGYTQPTVQRLVEIRGVNSNYHNNGIQMWKVESNGTVTNGNRT